MFRKIRTARYLKIRATLDMAEVSFSNSRIELLAATHQYDLREKQGNRGPMVKYPQWELLGIDVADIDQIEAFLLGLIMR